MHQKSLVMHLRSLSTTLIFLFSHPKSHQTCFKTYPFRHLSTMWIVVVELQHEDRDDHGQAHDHHGAGKVLS